ncbi:MAG: GNAT family N-acetyltransferase [Cyanothece sp. SIO2G6]|nr:GNAT family N-acetyltransferase [Cyanothece sp. SIO2G6]
MSIEVKIEGSSKLAEYAKIPIAFTVERVLAVRDAGFEGICLEEEKVDSPYIKDYDACPTEGPLTWAKRWNLCNWAFFAAYSKYQRVGGAAIAWDTPDIHMLEGRKDLAVLWDIRIHPEYQGKGLGGHLFKAAEEWAISKGCTLLKVETQNINVAACHFYKKQGCSLGAINRFAYPDFPEEVCLLWYKKLANQAMHADADKPRR